MTSVYTIKKNDQCRYYLYLRKERELHGKPNQNNNPDIQAALISDLVLLFQKAAIIMNANHRRTLYAADLCEANPVLNRLLADQKDSQMAKNMHGAHFSTNGINMYIHYYSPSCLGFHPRISKRARAAFRVYLLEKLRLYAVSTKVEVKKRD